MRFPRRQRRGVPPVLIPVLLEERVAVAVAAAAAGPLWSWSR